MSSARKLDLVVAAALAMNCVEGDGLGGGVGAFLEFDDLILERSSACCYLVPSCDSSGE